MDRGKVMTFQTKSHKDCNLTSRYFTVVKANHTRDVVDDGTHLMFYAITGDFGDHAVFDDIVKELPRATRKRKYQHQIAYIHCTHGWIHDLTVFERSLGVQGPFENPRRCGIGTVLTELCLIDPEVNVRGEGNLALDNLNAYSSMVNMVQTHCHKLVGLRMAADPRAAGVMYLTAAIAMGYEYLIVDSTWPQTDEKPNVSHSDKDKNPIKIYETQVAQAHYDAPTGIIKPCGCYQKECQAYQRRWFFCGETLGFCLKINRLFKIVQYPLFY